MRLLTTAILALVFITGCATWDGVKQDSEEAYLWSKDKVQKGVDYIKE